MSTIEITSASTASKPATSIGSVGKGAFTGLGGYMTLGLGAKLRPCITHVGDDEALVAKDSTCFIHTARHRLSNHSADEGLFVGIDGKPSRKAHIPWPAPPEDVSTSCE
jgi:Vam6/Vps39-like protein vacuolar protein sorting-associated protein 39